MRKITARDMALQVLKAVDGEGAYAGLALNHILGKYRPGKLDRAFATELAYGVLRSLNTLDWVLGRFFKKPLSDQTVWIRNILRLGVYQLLFMDRVPPSAVCNEAAELARKYGRAGTVRFVNGVLRNVVRKKKEISFPDRSEDPVAHISLRYSHPSWLVEQWLSEFGEEGTIRLCQANNKPAPNAGRTNTLKVTRAELAGRLVKEDLTVAETAFAPEGLIINGFLSLSELPSFQEGLFLMQDEGSMLVSHALAPAPGARVLDACGAPGSKTTHLAQLMGNSGEILAVDIHPHKLSLIQDNCRRLGITIVKCLSADARDLPGEFKHWADYALVDAPCTGLGVLRRRPDARWRSRDLPVLVRLQSEILDRVSACLRPGGILVYSTCTINREENHDQVRCFLNRHPEFEIADLRRFLPGSLDCGGGCLARGYIQLLPHVHGTDGFFIARLRKKGLGV
ncbi:MAG: 16S rRNA (cytosine(967)-C(5))-methyltransferase RsmB [Peptococcaceae bacterium]|nr:MAG: 16S rRNA (cytosine(967)-C(5))-methyltransferase RsmB [Peptococcaceae bacterium]